MFGSYHDGAGAVPLVPAGVGGVSSSALRSGELGPEHVPPEARGAWLAWRAGRGGGGGGTEELR